MAGGLFAAFFSARGIWNEPNTDYFRRPAANAGQYAELLKRPDQAAKEERPDAAVVLGGLSCYDERAARIRMCSSTHPIRRAPETVLTSWAFTPVPRDRGKPDNEAPWANSTSGAAILPATTAGVTQITHPAL